MEKKRILFVGVMGDPYSIVVGDSLKEQYGYNVSLMQRYQIPERAIDPELHTIVYIPRYTQRHCPLNFSMSLVYLKDNNNMFNNLCPSVYITDTLGTVNDLHQKYPNAKIFVCSTPDYLELHRETIAVSGAVPLDAYSDMDEIAEALG
ncbi:MAG: hypothetical protein QMD85_01865 [Candidatus Aenigmarchaeota archaeon]|nr:hypothetical protein [Candidatus Aenigmarchaeota archaeon]MDI6722296.1 hypothetical protein [Candidatus Aenigmarchaeota archaeon]